jgi:PAS domain S-box-containing protein
LIIDRLGRLSWDDAPAPQFEQATTETKMGLVFGALQLMHADVTEIVGELNNRMDELSQSKKQLSMAQRVAHLGSWEWVIPTNSITWSEETFRIYGYEPNAVSVDYSLFLNHQHPDSRSMVEACIRETLENDAPFDHVRRICQLDGSERVVSSRGYLERDEHGQALRMYGTIHDITDVVTARNAEEQAHEEMSAREAALRSTLVDLSHDVRTPLASLKLGIGRLSGLDMKSNLLSSLIAEVEYLDGLFANIMSLVRFKSSTIELRMHPFGVNDVLERVKARLSILALERNISIECAATDEDLQVCGDPLALEQAMGNLVHNGIKFAKGNVAILLDREDDRAVFEVRDDGPGLLDIEIPRLTDRYYQGLDKANRAGRGQGLGLPIAKAIIDEHGGSLKLGRLPAGGTVVTVSLPLAK